MSTPEWIELGTIGRPHGIRGEVTLFVPARYQDAFAEIDTVYWNKAKSTAPIESVRFHKGHFLVQFRKVTDRDAAESVRGTAVFAKIDDLREAGFSATFPDELIGFAVVTEEGESVGVVEDVVDYPASELLQVRNGSREHLIPNVPAIVIAVEQEAKRIVVRPTPGLLDLNND